MISIFRQISILIVASFHPPLSSPHFVYHQRLRLSSPWKPSPSMQSLLGAYLVFSCLLAPASLSLVLVASSMVVLSSNPWGDFKPTAKVKALGFFGIVGTLNQLISRSFKEVVSDLANLDKVDGIPEKFREPTPSSSSIDVSKCFHIMSILISSSFTADVSEFFGGFVLGVFAIDCGLRSLYSSLLF
ncbi:hypothetical protein MA16_Dca015243 [Dendrobium catenatum]|uniref:Uncharacterized protein n=1 Tax=Dendrobium catenatum TaxID=906689 RepID=A0A2I0VSF2_9ASPA|nr:hypothetical protein MA16_Dca015243 [Dendrobium catenatum]